MQDPHAGQPGTFYTDPDTGERITAEAWDAKQQAKAAKPTKAAPAKTQTPDAEE